MPITINVGQSKKVGIANYGSIGASCNVSFEAGHDLLDNNLKAFHAKVKNAFTACRQAVQDELTRVQNNEPVNGASNSTVERSATAHANGNGHGSNGNCHRGGHDSGQCNHAASIKQMDFAKQLARSIPGLGFRRLEALANTMFSKPLASLTSMDASGLIDTLKSIKSGEIHLDTVLEKTP